MLKRSIPIGDKYVVFVYAEAGGTVSVRACQRGMCWPLKRFGTKRSPSIRWLTKEVHKAVEFLVKYQSVEQEAKSRVCAVVDATLCLEGLAE